MKRTIKMLSAICLSLVIFTGCMPADTPGIDTENIDFIQLKEPTAGQATAVITTTIGEITMVLFENEAPNTVANFKQLVEEGFYNGRPIFLEQDSNSIVTGSANDIGTEGKVANDGDPIHVEVTPNLWHFSGAVSVLGYEKNKFSKDMLSDSRFFMIGNCEASSEMVEEMEKYNYPEKVIDAYKENGGLPQYTGSYTVFGQIIDGIEIVDELLAMEKNEETMGPKNGAKIEKIELSTYKAAQDRLAG